MTNIHKEIENRLNFLEVEQTGQDDALKELNELDAEVERLNNLLAQMTSDEDSAVNPETDFSHLRNNTETERLEKELKGKQAKNSTHVGYVISLLFDPKSPTEWSGSGWRTQGGGKSYSQEEAQQVYQKLKQQWPHYPLEILKK